MVVVGEEILHSPLRHRSEKNDSETIQIGIDWLR